MSCLAFALGAFAYLRTFLGVAHALMTAGGLAVPIGLLPWAYRGKHVPLFAGCVVTVAWTTDWIVMGLMVHGEEDWNSGIGLAIGQLLVAAASLVGLIMTANEYLKGSRSPLRTLAALALNLVPAAHWLIGWISLL